MDDVKSKSQILAKLKEAREKISELQKKEEAAKLQYQSFPIPTYTWKKTGDDFELTNHNLAANKITKGHISEYLGITLSTLHKDDQQIIDHIHHCYNNKTTIKKSINYTFQSTGQRKALIAYYTYVPPDKVIVNTEDITDRVQAETALKESEEKFRVIGTAALDAVVLMDPKGNVAYWNPAAQRMFGYKQEETLGKNVHKILMHDKYKEQFAKGFEKFQKTGKGKVVGKVVELDAKHKNGKILPIEISVSPIILQGKFGAVTIIRDMTERKRSEKEKEELREQLYQSQKMETVGTLAGGIAHDINNILQTVFNNIYLSMSELGDDHPANIHLKEILKAGRRAKDLVDQILTFSRQLQKKKQAGGSGAGRERNNQNAQTDNSAQHQY